MQSFISVKLWKQTKIYSNIFDAFNKKKLVTKVLGTNGNWKRMNILRLAFCC